MTLLYSYTKVLLLAILFAAPLEGSKAQSSNNAASGLSHDPQLAELQIVYDYNTLIVYSAEAEGVAYDRIDGMRNSPFAAAVKDHVSTPELEFREVLVRIRKDVYERTALASLKPQWPVIEDNLLFAVYLNGGPSPVSSITPELRVAWVIGNGAYEAINPLVSPAQDAEDVGLILSDRLDFSVVTTIDVDHSEFLEDEAEFLTWSKGVDIVFIYFAGIGVTLSGSDFLLPVDAVLDGPHSVAEQAIAIEDTLAALRHVPIVIVMLDGVTKWVEPTDHR